MKLLDICLKMIMKITIFTNFINYINHFLVRFLLPLYKYLEKIRSDLTKMIKNYKVKLNVNSVFKSKKNSNDECNVFIESKDTTDIDEIFDQFIKKHDDLTNSFKDIGFVSKGIESIIYNFTEVIIMNTFVETPKWLVSKKVCIKFAKQ